MKKIFANNDTTKFALVDDDVFETIQEMNLKFMIQQNGYFISTTEIKLPGMMKKRHLLLHRFVFTLKTGEEPVRTVDHIDRNRANNQFSNLRLATRQQQLQNRGKRNDNSSGYIGVSHKHTTNNYGTYYNYWLASVNNLSGKIKTKRFPFTDEGLIAAAHWRDQKAIKYYGKFCGELNFPDDHTKTA